MQSEARIQESNAAAVQPRAVSEKRVLERIVNHLMARKRRGEPVWWFKVHGGAYQKSGIPDLCVVYFGMAVFLEVKKSRGGKVSAIQVHTIQQIRQAGGISLVVTSAENVKALFDGLFSRFRQNHLANRKAQMLVTLDKQAASQSNSAESMHNTQAQSPHDAREAPNQELAQSPVEIPQDE